MKKAVNNRAASVRQRLLDRARANHDDYQMLLDRYAVERLLYRLSVSKYRDQFVLKGALLFSVWFDHPHRPTRDADFLAFGTPDAARIETVLHDVCAIEADDGLVYNMQALVTEPIREHARYVGLRANFFATLAGARCVIQLDFGFGDAVTPAAVEATFPSLLGDMPAPMLNVYPREATCAEKLDAIVQLGITNSRMKDYFDLLALAREGALNRILLSQSIFATFTRRGTPLPTNLPVGLTTEFSRDVQKREQWAGFLIRNRLVASELSAVVEELGVYFGSVLVAAAKLDGGHSASQ